MLEADKFEFGAQDKVFLAILGQLGSNLEVQEPPNSSPKPEKIDVEKQHVFGIDFRRFGLRFRMIFWWFFEGNAELISNCASKLRTLKIVIFPRENAYFYKISFFAFDVHRCRK